MTAEHRQALVQPMVNLNHPAPLSGSGSKVKGIGREHDVSRLRPGEKKAPGKSYSPFQCLKWLQESSGGTLDKGLEGQKKGEWLYTARGQILGRNRSLSGG